MIVEAHVIPAEVPESVFNIPLRSRYSSIDQTGTTRQRVVIPAQVPESVFNIPMRSRY
jgi:hypothetical protein